MHTETRIVWQKDSETSWDAATFRPTTAQNGFIRPLDIFLLDKV